jgi:8-oxo-dGTP pyrophosphatase MutT (NUDIX family)
MSLVNFGYRLAYNLVYPLVRPVWWLIGRDLEGVYVAIWHEGRVLAIKNSYKREYCLPGGMIDAGETPAEAGARELGEEVGIPIVATDLEMVHEIVQSRGRSSDRAYVMSMEWTGERPAVTIDQREVVWADFVTPADLLARELPAGLRRYLLEAAAARGLAS